MIAQAKFEELTQAQEQSIQSMIAFAEKSLSAMEKMTALNLSTANNALAFASSNAKEALEIQSPKEFATYQAAQIQPLVNHVMDYARSMHEINKEVSNELQQEFRAHIDKAMTDVHGMIEEMANAAPYGSDLAKATIEQVMASAKESYAKLQQAGESAMAFADSATDAVARKTTKRKAK